MRWWKVRWDYWEVYVNVYKSIKNGRWQGREANAARKSGEVLDQC